MCEDFEGGVSQIAPINSTSEIRYLSPWCAPAATLRSSVDQLAELEEYDTQPKSPTTIARAVSTTLRELEGSSDILGSGIKGGVFSQTEWEFVQNNMKLLGLTRGENSGYIYPNSFKNKRQAMRILMEHLRGTDSSAPLPRGTLREKHEFFTELHRGDAKYTNRGYLP